MSRKCIKTVDPECKLKWSEFLCCYYSLKTVLSSKPRAHNFHYSCFLFHLIYSEWQKLRTALLSWVNLFHRKLPSLPRLGEKILLAGKSNQETKNIKLLLRRLADLCFITMSIVYYSILSLQIFKHKCFSSLSFGGLENLRFSRLSSQLYSMNKQKLSSSCSSGDSNSCPPDLELGGGGGSN